MGELSQDDKSLVLSLVRAHLLAGDEYVSYVPPYVKVRWSDKTEHCVAERVGGHYRRKALCKRALDALACVCVQQEIGAPEPEHPPTGRARRR